MPRWLVFVIGAAVAAIAALWVARPFMPERNAASQTSMADGAVAKRGDLTSPLGVDVPASAATVAPAPTGGRFKLVGVVAHGSEGLALIAVDGGPARAFSVGATVEGDIVVRDVSAHGATLGPRGGGAAMALEVSITPPLAAVVAPVPLAPTVPVSKAPLADGSAQSQEVLRKLGSRHPPIAPQTMAAPHKPIDATVAPPDDGRWRPPTGQ